MNLIGKESVENTEMELEELLSAAWAAQSAQLRYQLHSDEPHAGPDSQETHGKEGDTA
jgi:hypothetical protein